MSERPPVAPGHHPVVGHTLSVLRDPLDAIQRWGRTDDDLVRLRIAGRTMVLATVPDAAKQVLATDSDSYQKAEIVRKRLGTLQGNSLVLLEGEQWRDRRQTLQPAFAPEKLSATGTLTTDHAREMVAEWKPGATVRVVDETRTFVLGVLAEALFGLELREGTPIHEAADDILARLDLRSPSTYLPEWVPTPTNRRFQRAVSTLHDRLDSIVENGEGEESLLGQMRAAGLSSPEMRDELVALLFAGYDSTATALSCTLGLLGTHSQVQAELRTELADTLDGRPPTPTDLPELELLDAVVKESLRLYPPQYLLFREPTADTALAGYRVRAGTPVVVAPWVLHRDPTVWDAPSTFRPGRWLDDEPSRPEYASLPYGAGPRYCLGANMADQLLRLAVAVVCQHGRFRASSPVSVTAGPTLAVDETLRLRLVD